MQEEVGQARQVRERWGKRAQAADALDAVIDDISELATLSQPVPTSPAEPQDAFWEEWSAQGTGLEQCVPASLSELEKFSCSICHLNDAEPGLGYGKFPEYSVS